MSGSLNQDIICSVNIYLELTEAFNTGALRAIICSGQAVVLHRLAIMSKDGDWILREIKAVSNMFSLFSTRTAHAIASERRSTLGG